MLNLTGKKYCTLYLRFLLNFLSVTISIFMPKYSVTLSFFSEYLYF